MSGPWYPTLRCFETSQSTVDREYEYFLRLVYLYNSHAQPKPKIT